MDINLPDADDLSLAALDATSTHVDWRGNPREWHHYEAVYAESVHLAEGSKDVLVWPRDRSGYEHLHEIAAGPMMNYAYELPALSNYQSPSRDPSRAAELLVGLPLCIVDAEFLGEGWHLALTGGGMDLSWEICEAYVRLGFLPPTEFANLPRMASRGESSHDQQIISACKRSFEETSSRASQKMGRLENNFAAIA